MEYIKILKDIDEFQELTYIQRAACGFEDIDLVPLHIFRAASDLLKPNGMVLGYVIDRKIVGFLMTLPMSNYKEVLMHIGGIYHRYQNKGIFYKLMAEMLKIMKSNNVDKIFGIYDPLESIHAHLYIRKLGGIITAHYIDYNGEWNSKLGLPTDRFRVEWILKDKLIEKIKKIKNGIQNSEINSDDKTIKYIDIPLDIQGLKNKDVDKAVEWRMKTRKLFDEYVTKQSFIVVDYIIDQANQKGTYVLKKTGL